MTVTASPSPAAELTGADRYRALRPVFAPRSIAVVGAKDSGPLFLGSKAVMQALDRLGFDGDIHLINRNGTPAFGRPATRTLAELGVRVDTAAMAVPAHAILSFMPDLAAGGVRGMTSLASGLSETGAEGSLMQQRIVDAAVGSGIELVGPNCLGFVNFVDRVGVWFSGLPSPVRTGAVAIVSQSGGVGDAVMEAAHNLGIGLSYLITTGNEPMIAVADALEYLVEDPSTRSIVVFAEGVKKPHVFIRAAKRAQELGKAIVMVKAGSSEIGARNAVSHTGSMVGDDAVTDAALRQLGVVRVRSLENALATAHLAASVGPIARPGIGVVSLSGGSCSLFADAASERGLVLPDFTEETTAKLRGLVSEFATIQNPFDVTGATDEYTFERVLEVVAQQPDIGLIAVMCNVPTHQSGATADVVARLESIARGMSAASVPTVLISQTSAHLHPFGRDLVEAAGIAVALPGIDGGVAALERLSWWSAAVRAPSALAGDESTSEQSPSRTLSEWSSREVLARAGVPMVPAILTNSPAAAVSAWMQFGSVPVALKVISPDIPHKSDIGGVVLGAADVGAVQAAFARIVEAVAIARPDAAIEGIAVSPMRSEGRELVVGVNRDPQWGLALVVGLGGVLVEVLHDTAIRVLPVSRNDVESMLDELAGRALLGPHRGRPGVNLEAVADAVLAIADAAVQVGERLLSIEVNPLMVSETGAEALDALLVERAE